MAKKTIYQESCRIHECVILKRLSKLTKSQCVVPKK